MAAAAAVDGEAAVMASGSATREDAKRARLLLVVAVVSTLLSAGEDRFPSVGRCCACALVNMWCFWEGSDRDDGGISRVKGAGEGREKTDAILI